MHEKNGVTLDIIVRVISTYGRCYFAQKLMVLDTFGGICLLNRYVFKQYWQKSYCLMSVTYSQELDFVLVEQGEDLWYKTWQLNYEVHS